MIKKYWDEDSLRDLFSKAKSEDCEKEVRDMIKSLKNVSN